MSKLLYITAHPLDENRSFSMAVGKSFIEKYKVLNPSHEIIHLDLFKENIPFIDADVFAAWGKLQSGTSFSDLNAQEQAKVGKLSALCDQFLAADKYVFVSPLWNFSSPPVLKAYIDAITVAGKTFKYTETGPVGLLQGKKALHIQARGGQYTGTPLAAMEMGHRHLSSVLGFLGVQDMEGIFAEGHAAMPEKANEIKENAIDRAIEMAHKF